MKKKLSLPFLLIFLIVFSPLTSLTVAASTATVKDSYFYQIENYILPTSNKSVLTEKDLFELSPYYIDLARNEIYARHGYVFKSDSYKYYFSDMPWYKKNTKFKESLLSSLEKKNVIFLKAYSDKLKANFKKVTGNKFSIDLNADGKKDAIEFNCLPGSNDYTLTVNNSSISGTGINLDGVIYICDIASKDKYKEIAITESGPSSDNFTYIYYYNGNELLFMGGVQGSDYTIKMNGSGTFSTKSRGDILQTWFYTDQYKLTSSHKLVNIPQKLYKMNTLVTLKMQLKLQKSPTDTNTAVVLKSGEKVMITDTDNKNWCAIETSKGVKGWFAVDNFSQINARIGSDIFDGLCYAD